MSHLARRLICRTEKIYSTPNLGPRAPELALRALQHKGNRRCLHTLFVESPQTNEYNLSIRKYGTVVKLDHFSLSMLQILYAQFETRYRLKSTGWYN